MDRYTAAFSWMCSSRTSVWVPQLSGSSGLGAEHRSRIYGAWGSQDLRELHALIALAKARKFAAVILVGHSYGAYLALLSANRKLDGLVAIAPFSTVDDLWQNVASSKVLLTEWGLDHAYCRQNCGRPPAARERLARHVCVVGSRQDHVTPWTEELSDYASELCCSSGDILEVLDFDHSLVRCEDAAMVGRIVRGFFSEHFGV
ncbi:alpha/beta fold hydrolase [Nanchangia anserum]|uniref:Alpha/beta fold hydrolase n=1 Tax=Nanchangia anserum TaxID=2692125 RepID=A0A8I0GBV4_9ACTO|nr:alpha/beta fold hydrolase [Nanchangia anserum]QOX81388.1 alpha/beta fold hydrolase [Nanchangia anserum]